MSDDGCRRREGKQNLFQVERGANVGSDFTLIEVESVSGTTLNEQVTDTRNESGSTLK